MSRRIALLAAGLVCTSSAQAQLSKAVGVVVDSVRGRPLVGATIVVSGTDVQGVSDSTGRFVIDSIPAGEHTMAVLHPFLDEMGLSLTTNRIAFAPGATMAVLLATPSAQSWIGRRCSDAQRQEGAGAVIGHVLQLTGDDPVGGALVHYTGTVIIVGKDVGLRHVSITRDASATPEGDFIVCGVPPGALGTIRASKGRVTSGDLPADLSDAPLIAVTLRLAPDDTLPTHTGLVTGRVVDDKGAPVPAARVTLRGGQSTQATDSGTFSLRAVPLGSQVLEIEKAGFPKTTTVVTILGPQPVIVSIALTAPPPMSAEAALVSVGFVRRRLAGNGVFVTADTIAKRKARNVADLQPLFPSTIMRPTSSGPILVPTNASTTRCIWYVVDGMPYQWYGAGRFNQEVPASIVMGIEYYQYGHLPQEFADKFITRVRTPPPNSRHVGGYIPNIDPKCSMLVIWTTNSVGAPPSSQ